MQIRNKPLEIIFILVICLAAILTSLNHSKLQANNEHNIIWKKSFKGKVHGAPAVANNGSIYFGSTSGMFYAVNQDGSLRWSKRLSRERRFFDRAFYTPAVSKKGTIYVVKAIGDRLLALDSTGTIKWSQKYASGKVAIGKDGAIYAGGPKIQAFNPDGSRKWYFDAEKDLTDFSSPSIGSNNVIYSGLQLHPYDTEGNRGLVALSSSGHRKWKVTYYTEYETFQPAIGPRERIYSTAQFFRGGSFFALKHGRKIWKHDIGGFSGSTPVLYHGMVYVPGPNNLCAFSVNGNLKWQRFIGTTSATPAVSKEGVIYIGANSYFYGINPDGSVKWKYKVQGKITTSPVLTENGNIYVTSFVEDNKMTNLYAFEGSSSGLAKASWPMLGQNPQHTGRVPEDFNKTLPISGSFKLVRKEEPINVGDDFQVKVEGQNKYGIVKLRLWYKGNWHEEECNGKNQCSNTWTIKKQKKGRIPVFGQIVGLYRTGIQGAPVDIEPSPLNIGKVEDENSKTKKENDRLPKAKLTASKKKVRVGERINLDASSSSDPNGDIVLYDFEKDAEARNKDEGTIEQISRIKKPKQTIAYNLPGTYYPTVRVKDDDGNWSESKKNLKIKVKPFSHGEVWNKPFSRAEGITWTNEINFGLGKVWGIGTANYQNGKLSVATAGLGGILSATSREEIATLRHDLSLSKLVDEKGTYTFKVHLSYRDFSLSFPVDAPYVNRITAGMQAEDSMIYTAVGPKEHFPNPVFCSNESCKSLTSFEESFVKSFAMEGLEILTGDLSDQKAIKMIDCSQALSSKFTKLRTVAENIQKKKATLKLTSKVDPAKDYLWVGASAGMVNANIGEGQIAIHLLFATVDKIEVFPGSNKS